MITQKQCDAIVKLDSLINVKIWDSKERRFIIRMHHKVTDINATLNWREKKVIMILYRKYNPEAPVKGIHPLRITVKKKSGVKTYTYWQGWVQKNKKKVRVGCFPYTEKGLALANEMCNKKRNILENA